MLNIIMDDLCLLPEHAVFISPQGVVTACCVSMRDPWGTVNHSQPIEIYRGPAAQTFRESFLRGSLPQSCDQCVNRERYALREAKTQMIKRHLHEAKPGYPLHADITLGNICPLSCVMCNSTFSHTWARLLGRPSDVWSIAGADLSEIIELIRFCRWIEIKGGDPFSLPYFYQFLTALYDVNPDVGLHLLTSTVGIKQPQLAALARFPNVQLGASIEARGRLYQWIRGGQHSEQDLWQKLELCHEQGLINPETHFYFSSTLGLYNFSTWHEHHREIDQRFRTMFGFSAHWALNLITEPHHQSVYLVRQDLRQQWLAELEASDLELDHRQFLQVTEQRTPATTPSDIRRAIQFYDTMRGFTLDSVAPQALDCLDQRWR